MRSRSAPAISARRTTNVGSAVRRGSAAPVSKLTFAQDDDDENEEGKENDVANDEGPQKKTLPAKTLRPAADGGPLIIDGGDAAVAAKNPLAANNTLVI